MSPEEIRTHNACKRDVIVALTLYARQHQLGEVLVDGVLFTSAAAGISTEPDVLFSNWETLSSGRVEYRTSGSKGDRRIEVTGAPDLLIEIVSRSSVRKDTIDLRLAYHQAGVREYWLIDARGDELLFDVLVWSPAEFVPATRPTSLHQQSAVLGQPVRLTRDRDRIGGWQYTLHIGSDPALDAPPLSAQ